MCFVGSFRKLCYTISTIRTGAISFWFVSSSAVRCWLPRIHCCRIHLATRLTIINSHRTYTRGDRRRNRSERLSWRLSRRSFPRQSPRRSPRVYITGDHRQHDHHLVARLNRCSSRQRSPVVCTRGDCHGNRRYNNRRDSRLVYTLLAIVATMIALTVAATIAPCIRPITDF